jgi:Fe-S cluster assembly protein SufD
LPSAIAAAVPPAHLEDAIPALNTQILEARRRKELLARSFELRSGREKPNRFWKIDLDTIDFSSLDVAPAPEPRISAPQARGLVACDLNRAAAEHSEVFSRTFGTAVRADGQKYSALAAALNNTGAFIYVPADVAVDEPIEIIYETAGGALFPYTLIVMERGAQATVIERLSDSSGAFVCGVTEIVTAESAHITYAAEQNLPKDARVFMTRVAKPGKDATVVWSVADIGAALAVGAIDVIVDNPGIDAQINGLFFPREDQHVDLISTVEHNVGDSQSQTLIKSAATGRGQARYLGNIRIAPHAQATESALRDDALLLSKRAHIDSVPALEIAANDVKAYHGATVGALDEEQIFYMTSRGIAREDAEKMIALGFFEPVLERFPTEALRARLREALQSKVIA